MILARLSKTLVVAGVVGGMAVAASADVAPVGTPLCNEATVDADTVFASQAAARFDTGAIGIGGFGNVSLTALGMRDLAADLLHSEAGKYSAGDGRSKQTSSDGFSVREGRVRLAAYRRVPGEDPFPADLSAYRRVPGRDPLSEDLPAWGDSDDSDSGSPTVPAPGGLLLGAMGLGLVGWAKRRLS